MSVVYSFTGEYRFLSNFFIEPDGTHVEREYQAQKCLRLEDINRFRLLTPGQAKRLGNQVELRPDWNLVRIPTMRLLVHQKFTDHECLMERLLATGDDLLVEGNRWGDRFWGKTQDGIGENWLGKILMEVRSRAQGN